MIEIIQHHNGIIVDFFGDAILVFFDPILVPFEDTVFTAVQCATDMQERMKTFNRQMREKDLPELSMGIGINAGQVVVGNIGSKTRAKYGIVGSAVNITSRIQTTADRNEIVISDTIRDCLKDQVQIKTSFQANLKGLDTPMQLHAIQYKS